MQTSFDSNFQTGVQATAFSTTAAPSLSRISMSNVMQTVATATATVVDPDGSKVYLRHKSATDANFGTAQESAALTETVSFTLTGLSAGLSYEVQASFDSNFQSGVRSTTFSHSAGCQRFPRRDVERLADRSDGDGDRGERRREHGLLAAKSSDG